MPSGPPGLAGAGAEEEPQRGREARQLDPNSREGLLKRLRDIGNVLLKLYSSSILFCFRITYIPDKIRD